MKRKVAQWIGGVLLSTISILIYLILYQTYLFSNIILNGLNTYVLQSTGLSIKGDVKGGILRKSMGVEKLHIRNTHTDNPLVEANDVSVEGWEWDWSSRELTLHQVRMENYSIHAENAVQRKTAGNEYGKSISTIFRDVKASNGVISFPRGDSSATIQMPNFHSSFTLIDGFFDSRIHTAVAVVPSITKDTLTVTGLLGMDKAGGVTVQALKVKTPDQQLDLDLGYSTEGFSIATSARNFNPNSFENVNLPDQFKDMLLDYQLDIQQTGDSLYMSGTGFVMLNGVRIPFQLHHLESNPSGDNFDVSLGSELQNVRIFAYRNPDGEENANINFFRFDMDPIINNPAVRVTEPIGKISVRGKQGDYVVDVILETFHLNNLHFDSFESDFTYSVDKGVDIFTALITQDNNWLNFSGKVYKDDIDVSGFVGFSDFSFLDLLGISNKISGEISSRFNIGGNIKNPRITSDIMPERLSYDNKLTLTGSGKLDFTLMDMKPVGNIALMGESGFLLGDSLRSYTILANTSEDGYFIEDLHLQGVNNLFSLSGHYDHNHITVNKLNIIKGDNQLKLADTVDIGRNQPGLFHIPSSVITFNNGGLSVQGTYSEQAGYALESEFELIDVDRVLDFFKLKVDFAGVASGKASITGNLVDPVIDTRFSLNNGVTLGYPSDSAMIDLRLTSLETISNSIDAITAGGSLNLVGKLPWGYKVTSAEIPYRPQNFVIKTENYRLRDLKFTQIVGMPIAGRATGNLSMRGTPADTKMDIELSLENASFDNLKFSKAYSELTYEGNLLNFDTLSMVSTWGYGSGSGYMPISLDVIAKDRMAVASRDMGLEFEFNLNEMPFLSSYISAIDAIEGDFIGSLGLTGPLSAPIRNGKVRGHNGRLELSILGNPITDVHAEITLLDNTLIIDHFSGEMNFSEGSSLNTQGAVGWLASKAGDLIGVNATQTYAGDITASGSMDMTSFFRPRFDINLKGDEVYYRSTDGLIEAIANADLQFTGQDTMNVEAVIPVLRAGYYANFGTETNYEAVVSKTDDILFKYSMNTQFASDLRISNDQLDAEFEGELWLLDYGDGVMRFSGTLTVQEGGKFYYLGNELDLVAGEIIFNSVDFNPQINMEAEIIIDGEEIRLTLSGDLIEPELVISTDNTQLTQSDVLTYLTLNKTLVEVSFDETALDPVKSYAEILMEKQLSKLGRDIVGLDLVGIDFDPDSTSNARFQLGQRLYKNFMVTYEGPIQPTGRETDYDFGFEYQINQNVSVTSKINQNGEVELNGRLKFTY